MEMASKNSQFGHVFPKNNQPQDYVNTEPRYLVMNSSPPNIYKENSINQKIIFPKETFNSNKGNLSNRVENYARSKNIYSKNTNKEVEFSQIRKVSSISLNKNNSVLSSKYLKPCVAGSTCILSLIIITGFIISGYQDETEEVSKIKEWLDKNSKESTNFESENIENILSIKPAFLQTESIDDKKTKDSEIVEWKNICCKSIKIGSSGRARHLYPSIMGDYRMVGNKSKTPIYIKTGDRIFLYKPERENRTLGYSWGVSHSPLARWGFIKSTLAGGCPDMGGGWRVYDRKMRRWAKDITMIVKCNWK